MEKVQSSREVLAPSKVQFINVDTQIEGQWKALITGLIMEDIINRKLCWVFADALYQWGSRPKLQAELFASVSILEPGPVCRAFHTTIQIKIWKIKI